MFSTGEEKIQLCMRLLEKNENVSLSDMDIQWHPAFYAAAELELSADRLALDFQREYNLSKKPLQIDLLVIRKLEDARIENEIGRIFRRYNIVEYKSPDDGMTIDDFFKTVGYACIYKGLGETADQIPIDQLTVSLFREGYPREMFRSLEKYGLAVKKECSGVYYIEGLMVPAQVVVTKELDGGKHRSLRVLSRNALEEDIRGFVEDAQKLTRQGDRANVDAILQVSISANHGLYDEMRRRSPDMCEAMRRLMRDEIEAEVREGRKEGQKEGRREGRIEQARKTAYKLQDMGLPIDKIAGEIDVGSEIVQKWLSERAVLTR